jgi:SAM-dependent methyltransferase
MTMTGGTTLQIDPANTDQARAWDGDEGGYWAEHAERFDACMARYQPPLLDAARIGSGDRVLDIGCGTGRTTRDAAARAPDGSALGVDLSTAMIEWARLRAVQERADNATFAHGDAQVYPFREASFDVAISRTGTMFFGEPHVAFANIARAIRPGGRLALLTWQPAIRNEWFTAFVTALAAGRDLPAPPPDRPGPFSMSDPDRVRRLLRGAGFVDVTVSARAEPMGWGRDAAEAHTFILGLLGWMLGGLDEVGRARARDALHTTLRDHETEDGVLLGSAAWLITARRPELQHGGFTPTRSV